MHLHPPVQNTTGCRIPQKWYVRGGISLTNRHMLSIVSCKSLGIPASGYLNTWKVGTLRTRSIEVAQLPKICSDTWSLIPVAYSPKSAVLLKQGEGDNRHSFCYCALYNLERGRVKEALVSSFRGARRLGVGQDRSRWDLATLKGFIFLMMREGDSYWDSSVPPACPVGALASYCAFIELRKVACSFNLTESASLIM